jgi:hypothetical protein
MAQQDNRELDYLPSAARTATKDGDPVKNDHWRGCHVIINVTSITATPLLTPRIQGKDPVSDGWYDVLVGSVISATGMTVLKVYPGIAAVANVAASDLLPSVFRVRIDHADADSATYSVGVHVAV